MKVSVLMPVYNTKERFLREAIESVLGQTWTDFEFLLFNNGSESGDVEAVIKSYKDQRINYLFSGKNLGITPARNKLIDISKGQYLAVMDHDDISLPQRFEKQVDFLDKNSDIGIVGCFTKTINEDGKSEGTAKYLIDDGDIKIALLTGCAIAHTACMIRKRVLTDNNIYYEEKFSPAEDYALFCRLIPHTKFHNIPEALLKYRWHSSNASITLGKQMQEADLLIRSFVQKDNPALVKARNSVPEITFIKLLGFIPFLKLKKTPRKNTIYLFCLIPIFTYKTRKVLQGIYLNY